ncbi:MAG TPA: LapA family protein [Thermodesulfobacteriota bacterium]
MSGIFRTLLIVAVAVLAGALAVQNNDQTSLRFIVWQTQTLPVWVFLLIALAIGVVLGGGSLLVDYARARRQLAREHRRADEATERALAAERELEALRARPVAVEPELRDRIEIVEEEDPESTAVSRPGRGSGTYE